LRKHILIAVEGNEAAVGVPNETVGDGSPKNPIRDIGETAVEQEFGNAARGLPSRSFLGLAAARKAEEIAVYLAGTALNTLFGGPVADVPIIPD
jgi:hypothetical protein